VHPNSVKLVLSKYSKLFKRRGRRGREEQEEEQEEEHEHEHERNSF